MNIKGIWGTLALTLLMPTILLAATQTLTITWNITDSSGISGYKMYYAYDDQMTNKTVACESYENPATTSSLTCTFDITQYPFFAQIAAVPSDGSAEILSTPQQIIESISTVQDFRVADNITGYTTSYAINFQPADVAVPDGFQADSGQVFSETTGYGWDSINTDTRDRDNTISPDQSYDTLIHADPTDTWEITLPNGSYSVTVCVGDPSWPNTSNTVLAENTAIISNGVISSEQPWIEQSATIAVADGRLTLTFTGSDPLAKLCWVKITSL